MPLIVGKSALEATLTAIYSDGKDLHSVEEFAKRKAQAISDFVLTGTPMTIITTFPGGVVGAMTAGPVQGAGLGGFDKPAPGIGLEAAKSIFEATLISIWTHGNSIHSYPEIAQKTAQAIFDYYSQAIIQTLDKSLGPLPAPPPVGPVTGPLTGIGGVNGAPAPGAGYAPSKPTMENEFIRIWNQIGAPGRSVPQFAQEISAAIHAFCIQGIVNTTGTFVAPAAVAPLPAPPNGAYFTGVGASIVGLIS